MDIIQVSINIRGGVGGEYFDVKLAIYVGWFYKDPKLISLGFKPNIERYWKSYEDGIQHDIVK